MIPRARPREGEKYLGCTMSRRTAFSSLRQTSKVRMIISMQLTILAGSRPITFLAVLPSRTRTFQSYSLIIIFRDTDPNAMQSTNHILLYGNDLGPNYSSTATQTILSQLSVLYIGLTSMHDSFGPHTTAPPLKLDSLTFSGPALHIDDTSLLPLNILRRRGSQYVLTPGLNISAFADAAVPVARAGGPEVASSLLPFANASAPILVEKLRHETYSCSWAYSH
ncbi:hypothetical protein BGY98DRAFT_47584 [Russula aff. rugulosa BPL654]|nr:hypothetical protein BGY98DRAFT_47584 [Russula aff. rugulosa BPL654]